MKDNDDDLQRILAEIPWSAIMIPLGLSLAVMVIAIVVVAMS